jgi:ubiquinone/menaquinone biosynthesis C-methylase UbiE
MVEAWLTCVRGVPNFTALHDGASRAAFSIFLPPATMGHSVQQSEPGDEIRPISHQSTNKKTFELVRPYLDRGAHVVDVGAGEGFFSKMMGDYVQTRGATPADVLAACDLFPSLFRYRGIACDPIGAEGRLPYDDASFDVVCSLEVIEHIEDQFHFVRELYRVLKPGGVAIISTPNVLNINSRLRFLHSGFGVLFDPLLLSSNDPVHTSGHIHPVTYYYLAYQLHRAGFASVSVEYDRFKSSAKFMLGVWGAMVAFGNARFRAHLASKKPDVQRENSAILADLNSRKMLTARSIIAIAHK